MLELRWLAKAVSSKLGTITQPVLILHPREDDRASIGNAFHLQHTLAGSVEMVVLEDSYHIVTLDRQRHVVMERTSRFVADVCQRLNGRSATAASVRAVRLAPIRAETTCSAA